MKKKGNGLENLVLITQLGINVLTPVFLCLLAGNWMDQALGTKSVLIWLILGILAGASSAYRMAKQTIEKEKKAKDEEKRVREARWSEQFGDSDGAGRDKRAHWD